MKESSDISTVVADNDNNHHEPDNRSKWRTYGGKVEEELLAQLREAQHNSGTKTFSDFMLTMLKIYRENTGTGEAPQMKVIKKAVTDIITTTENLLEAMDIIEADKFKAIDACRQETADSEQAAADKAQELQNMVTALEQLHQQLTKKETELSDTKKQLDAALAGKKEIEALISTVRQTALATEAKMKQLKIDQELMENKSNEAANKLKNVTEECHTLKNRLENALSTADRLQKELANTQHEVKQWQKAANEAENERSRLAGRLELLEPYYQQSLTKAVALETQLAQLTAQYKILQNSTNKAPIPAHPAKSS